MISVVIPTSASAAHLPSTLAALVPSAAEGLVREVVVVDAGSTDGTLAIADGMGCTVLHASGGRGAQLGRGAARAKHPWLLFLHADTRLSEGWMREAQSFIETVERRQVDRAAAFGLALDSFSTRARLVERVAAARFTLLGLPYGEQGLLLSRRFYETLGGHRPIPAADTDLVRRIGRRRLARLRSLAVVNPARYERAGATRRALRSLSSIAAALAGRHAKVARGDGG